MNRSGSSLMVAGLLAAQAVLVSAGEAAPAKPHRTDWFKDAGWGVFTHYLAGTETSADDWNQRVDAFDVQGLARQLASVGARYIIFTIGQNSGHYCSPNATYDSFVKISPSKCSRRDLIADLYEVLHLKGIRLMVYLPSGAPAADKEAWTRLEWEWGTSGGWPAGGGVRTGKRLAEFQRKWEAVIREWSRRWGKKVSGWWFDGCYFSDEMYKHPDPPNFASFAAAVRAGNPGSIVAFNPGVLDPIITLTDQEDYTAGEINEPLKVKCPGRWVGQTQTHMLSYLGPTWGGSPPRFTNQQVIDVSRRFIEQGGVVTWDVPIQPGGLIPQPFVDQLKALGSGLPRSPSRP